MNSFGQTICLSMIVKNEAHVIRRCLASVRSLIDHWVIVDTGSTDGTQDVIRAALADLPGALVERPWVDFAFNRTEALTLARPHADYALIIDADDELIDAERFVMPRLTEAGYDLEIVDGATRYWRTQLVDNRKDWRYRGVLHEFLQCPGNPTLTTLPLAMRRGNDGARHRDDRTESRDIAVLEGALAVEDDPFMVARYTFYLANAYRDGGEPRKAVEYYLKRADLGYWNEEIYIGLLCAADIMEASNEPEDAVLALYDRMIPICPARAEARLGASRFCRRRRKFAAGYRYAEAGLALPLPAEGISLHPWVYSYGLREEFSAHAFHMGQLRACLSACLDILKQPDVPGDVLSRASALARQALARMIDPAWGCQPSPYRSEFLPSWRL
jgi:glycosyltransferase involved in cell wall biosynthesis